MARSLSLTPEGAGEIFTTLDKSTANNIAYLLGGVADGATVKTVGEKLKPTK